MSGLIYLIIGAFSGLMAGALGIGGGTIVVPALLFVFQSHVNIPASVAMQAATATSLAIMFLITPSVLFVHFKLGTIPWSIVWRIWPGILVGLVFGVLLAEQISTDSLKMIFVLFLFCAAIKMILDTNTGKVRHFPSFWLHIPVTLLIGLQSGLLGIGAGIALVPYLTYSGVPLAQIVPVANLCNGFIALLGAAMFIVLGRQEMAMVPYATGYVYWPAVLCICIPSMVTASLGARLNYIVPAHYLKYSFIVLLFAIAIKMVV